MTPRRTYRRLRLQLHTDIAGRLSNRVQLTSDGLKCYVDAVEQGFGANIDYAMLVKMYTNDRSTEARYSPAECTGTRSVRVAGKPDEQYISTSYVERHNLSIRMTNRRYTRLTNAFRKKLRIMQHQLRLDIFAYNFIKIHRALRVSPAMAAGVTDRLWDVADLVAAWEFSENKPHRAA